jgi:hypothetical protein
MTFSLLRRCGDFISYANNCYAVYPIIRAVMQADSCHEFMQNTVMRHADYRHPDFWPRQRVGKV